MRSRFIASMQQQQQQLQHEQQHEQQLQQLQQQQFLLLVLQLKQQWPAGPVGRAVPPPLLVTGTQSICGTDQS